MIYIYIYILGRGQLSFDISVALKTTNILLTDKIQRTYKSMRDRKIQQHGTTAIKVNSSVSAKKKERNDVGDFGLIIV